MRRAIPAALLFLASLPAPAAELLVQTLQVRFEDTSTHADAGLEFTLDDAVREALEHGVPLTFSWRFELRDRREFRLDPVLWETSGTLRVDYRALSRRYSITEVESGIQESYPDMPRLMQALKAWSQEFPPLEPVVATAEQPALRFRLRLEISELPPALRLPSYLDDAWRLDTGWVERSLN